MKSVFTGICKGFAVVAAVSVCSFAKGPVPLPRTHPGHGIHTIIVDAGHGGMDHGAAGSYSLEKNITLQIATKLAATLQEALPDVKVVMTRTTDVFQPVTEKAQIANDNHGDLFLCIHANARVLIHRRLLGYRHHVYYTGKGANRKRHVRRIPVYHHYLVPDTNIKGTETYIFAARKTEDKIKYVMEDMEASEFDSDTTDTAAQQEQADLNDPEQEILAMLYAKKYFENSYILANMVENEFAKEGRSRGVMQRYEGIKVLEKTNMPAILVETGYITNPEEEDYLNSEKGQQEIAETITRAVVEYKAYVEGKQGVASPADTASGQ